MSRFTDSLIGATSYNMGRTSSASNLIYGGMGGFAPALSEYINNQQYIRQNLIPVLLEAPTGFKHLPNPDILYKTLKALVELHPLAWTGLNRTLTVETASTPVGGGGQMQEDPTDVKEEASNITLRLNEKYGKPVNRFLDYYIRYLIKDPNSKLAGVNHIATTKLADMLTDRFTFSMMFIEPNVLGNEVVEAYLVANMFFKSAGEVTSQRDLTAAGEPMNYDIPVSGIVQTGYAVTQLAQTMLNGMTMAGNDPYRRAAMISQVSPEVAALTRGYENSLESIAATGARV